MDLIDSMEMRWFLPAGDARIAALRERFADAASEGSRSDRYLLDARDDLGIKVRSAGSKSARLEAKFLLGMIGPFEIAPSIEGRVEQWRKLSAELAERASGDGEAWLEVRKDRRQRKLAFDGVRVTPVAITDRAAAGCTVELTKLELVPSAEEVWTFGFESFGPASELLAILSASVRAFAAERPGLVLEAKHSMSYAAWVRSRE